MVTSREGGAWEWRGEELVTPTCKQRIWGEGGAWEWEELVTSREKEELERGEGGELVAPRERSLRGGGIVQHGPSPCIMKGLVGGAVHHYAHVFNFMTSGLLDLSTHTTLCDVTS